MTDRPPSRDSSEESEARSEETSPATRPSFVETERQAAELAAMRRMLTASRGTFSISIAVCNSPALRAYLVDALREDDGDYVVVTVPRDTEDVLGYALSQLGSRLPAALFVVELENSLPSDGPRPALRLLNVAREKWQQSFAYPIVFWLPDYAVTLLATEAKDFWAWRSHQFEFVAELPEPAAAGSARFAGGLDDALNLDADRKQFRMAELRERINAAGADPDSEMAIHVVVWLNELGVLLTALGNLDEAETIHRRSLEIDEKLGRIEGVAASYGNLGITLGARGDLNGAEKMHRKSLEIAEKLGRPEDIATASGNLGLVFRARGNLDEAEKMLRRSQRIYEKLGRLEAMSRAYGNLGVISQSRGDLDEAEAMHRKSLEIDEKLGRLEGMAITQGNLGGILQARGDLEEAEKMLRKALTIDEKLGRREGMATQYGNLGLIFAKRGDLDKARLHWTKARDVFAQIGMPQMVERVERWLDGI